MSWLQYVGTAIELYSDYQQSQDADENSKDQADYLRKTSKHNKEISLLDAAAAEKDAIAAEQASGRKLRIQLRNIDTAIGSTRAKVGKSGVAMSGSALDVVVESARRGAQDSAMIINEGKTAFQKGMDVANRYRKLADYGLRDAAYQASLIESAGADESQYYQYQGAAHFFSAADEHGQQQGWWE
jgi:hypothetical protein